MFKKLFLVLVIAVLISGAAFAQYDHTITVDVMPLWVSLQYFMMNQEQGILQELGIDSSLFGIGFQYENQILPKVSLLGRIAYFGFGMGNSWNEESISARLQYNMNAWQFEGHARFYPGKVFFFDTTLGLSRLGANFSGSIIGEGDDGEKIRINISDNPSRYYIKSGIKLGWKIPIKRVVIEPAIGYDVIVARLGNSFGQQMFSSASSSVYNELDEMFSILEDFAFIGGPRVYLSIGYRF